MTGQEEYPRFISNRPCGNDKYEGKSQELELKATPFKPEYAGQLNFYINVVDDKLRGENDNKTIGLLLCRGKDEVVAQYALAGYDQPIGISDYQLSKAVPENLKSALPSIEEVEEELTLFLDKDKNP